MANIDIALPVFLGEKYRRTKKRHNKSRSYVSWIIRIAPCAVGITVDPVRCSSTDSNYESLTELRRRIWHFILAEVQQIPPHIKSFLEAEMEFDAIEFKALSDKQKLDKPGQNLSKQVIQNFLLKIFFFYYLSCWNCKYFSIVEVNTAKLCIIFTLTEFLLVLQNDVYI